jgi:hypothetical protein
MISQYSYAALNLKCLWGRGGGEGGHDTHWTSDSVLGAKLKNLHHISHGIYNYHRILLLLPLGNRTTCNVSRIHSTVDL